MNPNLRFVPLTLSYDGLARPWEIERALSQDGRRAGEMTPTELGDCRAAFEFNPFGSRLVRFLVSHVLGARGIQHDLRRGSRTRADRLQSIWERFAAMPDRAGESDWNGLTRQALIAMIVDGECYLILDDTDDGLRVSLHRRDRLTDYESGNVWLTQSENPAITRDANGQAVTYHFVAPIGDQPAERVIHLYDPAHSAHFRGLSWLRPALLSLQRMDALAQAFVSGATSLSRLPGVMLIPGEQFEQILNRQRPDSDPTADTTPIEPEDVVIQTDKFPENTIPVRSADDVTDGDLWVSFDRNLHGREILDTIETLKREAALALDLSYNRTASDLAGVNFSTGSLAAQDDRIVIEGAQRLMARLGRRMIYELWRRMSQPPAWESLTIRDILPSAIIIDPAKRASADKLALQNMTISRRQIIELDGRDADQTFAELREEQELLDDLNTQG